MKRFISFFMVCFLVLGFTLVWDQLEIRQTPDEIFGADWQFEEDDNVVNFWWYSPPTTLIALGVGKYVKIYHRLSGQLVDAYIDEVKKGIFYTRIKFAKKIPADQSNWHDFVVKSEL